MTVVFWYGQRKICYTVGEVPSQGAGKDGPLSLYLYLSISGRKPRTEKLRVHRPFFMKEKFKRGSKRIYVLVRVGVRSR